MNWLMHQTEKCETEGHFILSRVISFVAGPTFAALTIAYQLLAVTLKTPVMLVNYTIFLIPLKVDGEWVRAGSHLLPKGFEFTDMFKHVFKVFLLSADLLVCPIVGVVSPHTNAAIHRALGLMEQKQVPAEASCEQPIVAYASSDDNNRNDCLSSDILLEVPAENSQCPQTVALLESSSLSELDEQSILEVLDDESPTEELAENFTEEPAPQADNFIASAIAAHRANFIEVDDTSWDDDGDDTGSNGQSTPQIAAAIPAPPVQACIRSNRVSTFLSAASAVPSVNKAVVQQNLTLEDAVPKAPSEPRLLDSIRKFDSSVLRRTRTNIKPTGMQLSESVNKMLEKGSLLANPADDMESAFDD